MQLYTEAISAYSRTMKAIVKVSHKDPKTDSSAFYYRFHLPKY